MKKITLFLIVLFALNGSSIAQEGIRFFEGSWAEMLAKAKLENKIIFMDAYATWCGPCKKMAADVFPLKEVGDFYNTNFIPVKVDMEKGDGLALAKLYNVRAYPTLLFINWKGELVHRAVGGKQAEGLIELGKVALDDTQNFRAVERAYLSNPEDVNLMINYANALKQSYDKSYTSLITSYLKDKPKTLLLSETGWKLITDFVDDPASPEFQYLVSSRKSFSEMFGAEAVNKKIGEVIEVMIAQAVRKNDAKVMEELKARIVEINPEKVDYYLATADLQFSRRSSNWVTYPAAVFAVIALSPELDNQKLNSYAWDFYINIEDQTALKQMTELVAKAIKKEDSYAIHDTYAALLFKTRNYKLALKEAKAAVELAKKDGTDYADTLDLIADIEKAMGKK
jgi:thiol-disulfide isomerase/thioredoxin